MMRDEGPLIADYERSSPDHLKQTMQKIELATVVSTGILIWRSYGVRSAMRYLVGLVLALTVQRALLSAMIRKTDSKQASLADVLTLSRAGVCFLPFSATWTHSSTCGRAGCREEAAPGGAV